MRESEGGKNKDKKAVMVKLIELKKPQKAPGTGMKKYVFC
jgi:hypothetical protein